MSLLLAGFVGVKNKVHLTREILDQDQDRFSFDSTESFINSKNTIYLSIFNQNSHLTTVYEIFI